MEGSQVATGTQKFQNALIRPEHNGGAWHHAEHVRNEASVQRRHAFLFPDETEALHQPSVFDLAILGWSMTQTCSHNLKRKSVLSIADQWRPHTSWG